jgi:hypothetical protein
MGFKPLPPGLAKLLIEREPDVLGPLAEERLAQIHRAPCPSCGGAMQQTIYGPKAFLDGDLLPKTVARCVDCGCVYDHQTRLLLEPGNPWKVKAALPLIRTRDDD